MVHKQWNITATFRLTVRMVFHGENFLIYPLAIMPLNIFAPWLPFGAPKKASESRTKLYNMVEEFIKQNNEYEVKTIQ
jgi:hypothetical protein